MKILAVADTEARRFYDHYRPGCLNDFDSRTHRGFECFNFLLEKFRPQAFVHGHIHANYGMHIPKFTRHGDTLVVNAFEYAVFEVDGKKKSS